MLAGRLDSNQRLPQVLSHHSFTGQDRPSTPEVRHLDWLIPRQARDFIGPHHPPALEIYHTQRRDSRRGRREMLRFSCIGASRIALTRRRENEEMLTVKHIRFDGAETIDAADRVIFYPNVSPDANAPKSTVISGTITIVRDTLHSIDWNHGVIYVMNEHGATISKYDLGNGIIEAEQLVEPALA